MTARCDLHVHSKHSNRPPEWILRRLGSPESFMEPLEVYRRCKRRGMRFVTLSDHDEIGGALEIAHLPDTFVSCEVTAEFPEDGCQIHCLVWGIDEARHRMIQELRTNLYALRDYLFDHDIAHAVAHPLYRVNDRLTLEHFEKLLVLFKRFEGRNGIHDGRSNQTVEAIAAQLTPEVLFDLAERHRIDPRDPEPWVKRLTGGSDDHGGIYCATTWTETPEAATVGAFLELLRRGDHSPGGAAGSALRLTRSLYAIAWEDVRRRFPGSWRRRSPFERLLRRLARGGDGATVIALPRPGGLGRGGGRGEGGAATPEPDRRALAAASDATGAALRRMLYGGARAMRRGDPGAALGALSALGPAIAAAAPYLSALFAQYKDAPLVRAAAERFAPEAGERPPRAAWLCDGIDGGPAGRVLEAAAAVTRWREVVVLTCDDALAPASLAVRRFEPVVRLPLAGPELPPLPLPPALDVLGDLEGGGYGEVVVSAPGPMGLLGAAAARLLGLPLTCIYDPALPRLAREATGSPRIQDLAEDLVRWFCGLADRVLVHPLDRLSAEQRLGAASLEIARQAA